MHSTVQIVVTPTSVELGKNIAIDFLSEPPLSVGNVAWTVGRVTLDETTFVLASSSETVITEKGLRVVCSLPDNLEPGVYVLSHSEITPVGVAQTIRFGPLSNVLYVFEIRATETQPRENAAILQDYERMLEQREINFQIGIGTGANSYEVFVFVKNCLLTMNSRLDRCEVIPMSRLGTSDEITAIEKFFGVENSVIKEWAERVHSDSFGPPAFAVRFPNIRGDDHTVAMNAALEEVFLLTALYSLKRGGAGELFGCHIIDRATGQAWADIFDSPYRGNVLGGFLSGESPNEIRVAMGKLKLSETLRLYVQLFREARREQNIEVEVFRYWNLLESIARSKNFIGIEKRNWGGQILQNMKGSPIRVQDQAEELVFELLRQAFASTHTEENLLGGNGNTSLTEQLGVWYRRRNCVVHGGDCLCRNIGVPRTEAKYAKCKAEKQKALTNGDDQNLRSIRNVTEWIINIEIYK